MPLHDAQFRRQIADISDNDLLAALGFVVNTVDAWAVYWNSLDRPRWFRDADDLLLSEDQAVKSLEPIREDILAAAQRVLRHDIQGWGDISIQHESTVDFNADYGKNGKYGFHYWFWGRPLIQAYLLTRDEKYLAEFDALFNSWYEQRDKVRGEIAHLDVIYYELGLGLRARSFFEYYQLPYLHRSVRTHERMLKTLLGAGRWLFELERGDYRAGNWQVMGCTGLAWIAAMLPEFRESANWLNVACSQLSEHMQRDLYADGCHWERVPSDYMLTVHKDIRNVAALTSRADLHQATERMLEWYMRILPPDGIIPGINDGRRSPMPARLMREGLARFPASRLGSVHLPSSGFTVLRDETLYMLVNHGPMAGGHTHQDALSFELHINGLPAAIDPGIGKSYDDPLHEKWYVTPAAHNMLEVPGAKLDRAAAVGSEVIFKHSPLIDYFAATHHGYKLSASLAHRRHILFARHRYFLIVDEIHHASPVDLRWNLHLPFPNALSVLPDDKAWTLRRSRGMASVVGIAGLGDYAEINWLQFNTRATTGREIFAMLLYPGEGATLTRLSDGHWMIDHADGQDNILLAVDGSNADSEDFSFHGLCAMWRICDNQVTQWAVIQSTHFRLGNRTLHQSDSPADQSGVLP